MKWIKRIIKLSILGIIVFILGHVALYSFAKYVVTKIDIKNANSIYMYDNESTLFFQGNGTSEWANLDSISEYVINATLASEDRNFYSHIGFDYLRIMKVAFTNVLLGEKQAGASTITQQYARNLYLTMDKTWERKIEEAWISIQLETHYSKDEILEGYLNTINYGLGNYGIENAARFYFGKSASELTLGEASILVGIPKSPSNYSPLVDELAAKQRQQVVLNSMVNTGYITEEEKNEALNEELVYIGKKEKLNLSTLMYYQDAVIRELNTITSIPNSLIEAGNLKIYTALDINAQTVLENSINSILSSNNDIQTSAIMMDPNTGAIIALAGGRDYAKSQYNRAVQAKRQVGSTMKPFLYYAALENGFTASTTFKSAPTTFNLSNGKTYSPSNYSDKYGDKEISLAAAIAYSDNIYAVKTHLFLGQDMLVNLASRVGIEQSLEAIPSLPLGTGEMSITDLVSGYAAFANEGYKINSHLITKIEDKNGNILYQADDYKENVLNTNLVYILNDLLTGTHDFSMIEYYTPTALNLAPKMTHKYAIKTGSTDTDSVIVGYNSNIIMGVWCGYDDNSNLISSDSYLARNIWVNTVESYLEGKEVVWYQKPENVVGVLVNPITGVVAKNEDKNKKVLYYIKGTEPYIVNNNDLESVFEESN